MTLRLLTAGESHGPELTAIIEGLPSGMPLAAADINRELARRQKGYGRGGRMKIETDQVKITSGVRHGLTLGSPVTLVVENHDWKNWEKVMNADPNPEGAAKRRITHPRPGHADLVGGMKYDFADLRNVLERSSARETTMRVAVGAVAKKMLHELGIETAAVVTSLGGVAASIPERPLAEIQQLTEESAVRVADPKAEEAMIRAIDTAKKAGDTLGGTIRVIVENLPAGLGSYVEWDRKLDARLAMAVISINAFKAVSFGEGNQLGELPGSLVQDEIIWDKTRGYSRKTNHLGGMEGGMTSGMPLIINGVMKPIPTLYKPLDTVDIETKEVYQATVERSDTTAVPAAAVVMENVVATELAKVLSEQFSADNFERLKREVATYRTTLQNW